jgi:hypothetical protein
MSAAKRQAHQKCRPAPSRADERFAAYAAASRRAQSTLSLGDGIAAGRAWRDFLAAFERPSRTPRDGEAAPQ